MDGSADAGPQAEDRGHTLGRVLVLCAHGVFLPSEVDFGAMLNSQLALAGPKWTCLSVSRHLKLCFSVSRRNYHAGPVLYEGSGSHRMGGGLPGGLRTHVRPSWAEQWTHSFMCMFPGVSLCLALCAHVSVLPS